MENRSSKALSLLGLAKRAGAAAGGTEGVRSLCRSGKARLVLLAADASDNARKRILDCCAHYGVPLIGLAVGMRELGHAIGMGEAAAAAVGDRGLADAIRRQLERETPATEVHSGPLEE
ncbi:MAG: hypothetical protein GXX99_04670 [Clostridiales bacterium]|nr:hypothetical protein [Clostridiales bacterium]